MSKRISKYYSSLDTWITVGSKLESQVVSKNQDGIITPQIQDIIDSLEDFPPTHKIWPNLTAYFYYLYGRFKRYHFSVEDDCLRVELNRQFLLSALASRPCQGEKGSTG